MAIALCLVCAMSFGQKTFSSENFVVETVDEFGEKSGKIKVGILAEGYFSNSATTNSCARLMVNIMEDHSWFSLYEYCGNHASHDDLRIIFIGTKTKTEVSTTSRIPIEFIKLCADNDTINVKMYETSSYGSTRATFRLFNCNDFYKKYVKQFGDELLKFDEEYYRNKKPIILPLCATTSQYVTIFDLVPFEYNYITIRQKKGNKFYYYNSYITQDKTYKFQIENPGEYEVEIKTKYNTKNVKLFVE